MCIRDRSNTVPISADAYSESVSEARNANAKNFFDNYNMIECKIVENILSFKKQGSHEILKFELHNIGDTQNILKESKAFAIDMNSIAECTHLTKYFGPYDITKTTENKFIFTNGQESAVLSKSGW